MNDLANYVIVEGVHIHMPNPAAGNIQPPPPPQHDGQRRFPVLLTVRSINPWANPRFSSHDILRYKTEHKFLLSQNDCDIATVNRMVDLMNVPYDLNGINLFWKLAVGTIVGSERPVADWDDMVVLIREFLENAADGDDFGGAHHTSLLISKYEKLPEDEMKALAERVKREEATGEWTERVFRLPQRMMEFRMSVLQGKVIERVTVAGGGDDGGAERCGICLVDLGVGSVVARLPCSHCSHEGCILRWLMQKKSCPFCRFQIQIPAIDSGEQSVAHTIPATIVHGVGLSRNHKWSRRFLNRNWNRNYRNRVPIPPVRSRRFSCTV
ncbi:unnamed protein product [Cuscuta epithymum]|uniref:RING-type domain-containing protein n=1 Tax=Cuscuta epithymum TaxID=186058 RepID=A0AAV0CAP7_9ASTE|nr:unnamed protein product [Cuscuta epithymum]